MHPGASESEPHRVCTWCRDHLFTCGLSNCCTSKLKYFRHALAARCPLLSSFSVEMVACKIKMLSDLLLQTQETREILHFHYTTWPDFGVPESPASFLNFLFKVRESGCLNADHGPVVVHCSAGIGRSGTFCLVDTCLLLVRMKHCGKGMNE